MDPEELIAGAREASENAVAPYSEYHVGAAVATPAGVYPGCNVEVANYSNSLHAEEVAVAGAVVDGVREFEALAVTADATGAADSGTDDSDAVDSEEDGQKADDERFETGVTPCGMCRQTLVEFCDPEFPVYCDRGDGYEAFTLGELLPAAFGEQELD